MYFHTPNWHGTLFGLDRGSVVNGPQTRVYSNNGSGLLTCHWATTSQYQWERLLSGVPDYFGRNKISSGGDLSHYSSASLY